MAKPDFKADDAVEFWDLTNREDWWIAGESQAGITSRAYRPGPYSEREALLWAFDGVVRAEADEQKLETAPRARDHD
jgi:Rieske 2Fe-2S family protein